MPELKIFDTTLPTIVQILLSALLIYFAVIIAIRVIGKRTTSRMNNFDWVVTVAMGSIIATCVMDEKTSVVEGIVGAGSLMLLQYVTTFSTTHWQWAKDLFLAKPQLLFYRGQFLREPMNRERVSESEIRAAMRQQSDCDPDHIFAVVFEQDANLSVISEECDANDNVLTAVRGYEKRHDSTGAAADRSG